jgi:hypothetical protein
VPRVSGSSTFEGVLVDWSLERPVESPPVPVDLLSREQAAEEPNCGQRVGWADLDHVIAHSCDGPTSCTNLCCLCRTGRTAHR